MCEWSDFYYTVGLMSECYFGQCASGLVFTTPECASACLVNVRVILILQHRNVRVGYLFGQCASGPVMCNVRVR